ncbi:MAG: hypothetical protein CL610_06765 [Anaerolineaceae bacterium]|nr:hypothetical protein [Anaerolineaceae bacterium]
MLSIFCRNGLQCGTAFIFRSIGIVYLPIEVLTNTVFCPARIEQAEIFRQLRDAYEGWGFKNLGISANPIATLSSEGKGEPKLPLGAF